MRTIFMKKRMKIICASIIMCMAVGSMGSAGAMVATDVSYRAVSLHITSAEARVPPLSPALDSLRGSIALRKWGLVNDDVTFRPEEFEEILGLRRLRSVMITKLPDMRRGVLTLGGSDITAGQTIAREDIQHIRLVPYPNRAGNISFYFKDGENPGSSAILCSVNILETLNFPPTAYPVSISTQRNTPVFRAMKATDPDGDKLYFRIIQAPRRGLLEVRENGSFIYRPNRDFTGRDRFIYRVQDENGNWSNPATVDIRVVRAAANIRFTDMDEHWAANAAIKGVGAGFIDVNPDFRFNPSQLMTRAEFVYMALRAARLDRNLPEVMLTSFVDDSDIPVRYKAHVALAYDLGVINGVALETGIYFDPNNTIIRAEAAVILNNILQIPILPAAAGSPAFADAFLIPPWAAEHVAALNMHGIINGDPNGNFNPYGLLNRAQSAEMLSNMLDYTENSRRANRWWSSLPLLFGG